MTYNYAAEGYEIPIKYAQAVLCETPDEKFKWPKGVKRSFGDRLVVSLFLVVLTLVTLSF